MNTTPTGQAYSGLNRAYEFFNRALFANELPRCLITMQRHKGAYGYFAPARFGLRGDKSTVDEIAMNPAHFEERSDKETLSTLAHEMVHVWQQHFGKPSRNGYHNREWADKMRAIGLIPSTTGAAGGKEVGPKVSHYVEAGGLFDSTYAKFAAKGEISLFCDRWTEDPEKAKARQKKNASKTAFVCPECGQKAWAKETARLTCGDCDEAMEAQN